MHAGDGDLIDAVTDAAAEGLSALNASNVKILSDIDNKQTWSQGELFGWLGMVSGFANQVTIVLALSGPLGCAVQRLQRQSCLSLGFLAVFRKA